MIPVDAFDLKILGALQDDGRLTNQQLADAAGLSASQCSRRRMRLEDEKVITGYHADLSAEALGFDVIAFIQITLATQAAAHPLSVCAISSIQPWVSYGWSNVP